MPISFRTVGQACRGSGLARCAFCSVVRDLPDEFNETGFIIGPRVMGSPMSTPLIQTQVDRFWPHKRFSVSMRLIEPVAM